MFGCQVRHTYLCDRIFVAVARKYEQKRRAELQQETRRRIASAALELHDAVGPAKATISAIAEKAGVQRQTFYRHFPDELSLFRACSSLDLSENPLPDPDLWAPIADPEERLRAALAELYAYFRRRERILANVLRDAEGEAEANANVREVLKPMAARWERMREVLYVGWEVPDGASERLLGATIGVALDFQTWRMMVRGQGLSDEEAIEVMARMVRCLMHT
jgi:AcrR family transcriptional regulator